MYREIKVILLYKKVNVFHLCIQQLNWDAWGPQVKAHLTLLQLLNFPCGGRGAVPQTEAYIKMQKKHVQVIPVCEKLNWG